MVHDGTDSHMLVLDLTTLRGDDDTAVSGDVAARILDLAGIVCNRQTIPGDTNALNPSGIRLGTPWLTQRGCNESDTLQIADIIADLLLAIKPFSYTSRRGLQARGKIDFDVLQNARLSVRDIAERLGTDSDAPLPGYPHFAYSDDDYSPGWHTFEVSGVDAQTFLQLALTADVMTLADGQTIATNILEPDGRIMSHASISRHDARTWRLHVSGQPARVAAWLRALSDGFVIFDPQDIYAKLPGPVIVRYIGEAEKQFRLDDAQNVTSHKTTFIGYTGYTGYSSQAGDDARPPERFVWKQLTATDEPLQTPLHAIHLKLKATMGDFAGYDMPLWYDRLRNEHLAVRQHAGIFDVTHMGVFDLRGPGALSFLDAATTSDVTTLRVGQSQYTFLLDLKGIPHDDLLIYRLGDEHYMLVVNASNNDKDWAWLQALKQGTVLIDPDSPSRCITTQPFELRDLSAESSGSDRRVDIALQGPDSTDLLLQLGASDDTVDTVRRLPWGGVAHVTLGDYDLIVSRTGYTGERTAYEVFPHPDRAADLFAELIELGAVPCGLASRDSLRVEAGLPLYGHELAGPLKLDPKDAGMGQYVKLYKPFFVGKGGFVDRMQRRRETIVRFQLDGRGNRPPHQGDPVVDTRGTVVGIVTSRTMNPEGAQIGMALLRDDTYGRDSQLSVLANAQRSESPSPTEYHIGQRTSVPQPMTILRRFPLLRR